MHSKDLHSASFSCIATFPEPIHHKVLIDDSHLMVVSLNGQVLSLVFDLNDSANIPTKRMFFLPGPVLCCATIDQYFYFSTSRNVQKLSLTKLLEFSGSCSQETGNFLAEDGNLFEKLLASSEVMPCRNVIEIYSDNSRVVFMNKFGNVFKEQKPSTNQNQCNASKLESCMNLIGQKSAQLKEEQKRFRGMQKYLKLLNLFSSAELSKFFSVEAKFFKCDCSSTENKKKLKVTISISSQVDLELSSLMQFLISLHCEETGSTVAQSVNLAQNLTDRVFTTILETDGLDLDVKNPFDLSVNLVLLSSASGAFSEKNLNYSSDSGTFVFWVGNFKVLQ